MAQRNVETVKTPGMPKPYVERPRRRPKAAPRPVEPPPEEPPVRARLAWSRTIIDQNCNAAPAPPSNIPSVRSMAALRARAGMPVNTHSPIPLEPLLAAPAVEPRRPVARDIYRPALDPDPMPAPPPSISERLKAWINGFFE